MGLSDRDYMRGPRPEPKRKRPRRSGSNPNALDMSKAWWIIGGVALLIAITPLIWLGSTPKRSSSQPPPMDLDCLLDGEHAEKEQLRMLFEYEIVPLDINTASGEDLMTVPGIGFAIASRIINARPYATLEDLRRVHGIGESSLESMRPYLTVESVFSPDP